MTGLKTGLLGLEPSDPASQTPINKALSEPPTPDSTKYDTKCARQTAFDPDLTAVVDAWSGLPDAVKAGMVAMVRAATGGKDGR